MSLPETSGGFCGVLGQIRGALSVLAVSDREMTKHITHAFAEPASKPFNYLVYGVTRDAGIAAILDER
jgi:hypothetical protein